VASPTEIRGFVDECLDWARTARSERERQIFLQMARTWALAAIRATNYQAGLSTPLQPLLENENAAPAES
jgi:hypothetical protein